MISLLQPHTPALDELSRLADETIALAQQIQDTVERLRRQSELIFTNGEHDDAG